MSQEQAPRRSTRRQFLAVTTVFVAGTLAGCGGGGGGGGGAGGNSNQSKLKTRTVFKLSGRGRRISNAAKKHNANFLFTTQKLADRNRAHKGDKSRIVSLVITEAEFKALFKKKKIVDLRHIG
jgi:hypothetical protein